MYWMENEKEIRAANNLKRKLDHVTGQEPPQTSRPTLKDRRLSETLTTNNVVDLSNTGHSSQVDHVPEFNEFMKETHYDKLPDLHPKVAACIQKLFKKGSTIHKKYIRSLSYQQQSSKDALYIYEIISLILNEHYKKPRLFDLSDVGDEASEQDFNLVWGPLIILLFADTGIQIKSGDTVLADITKTFKIDYRLGVIINRKFVDIANIEVGKTPADSKIKQDHVKLILEAKSIVSRIISQFPYISPPSIEACSLQICGLKADLIKSTMQTPQQFVTRRSVDRIRLPLSTDNSHHMASFLQRLLLFREKVLSVAGDIKGQVNKAIDRRSSFDGTLSPQLKRNLPNYRSWLDQ